MWSADTSKTPKEGPLGCLFYLIPFEYGILKYFLELNIKVINIIVQKLSMIIQDTDFNDTIKMAASRYISNTSIIIVKYMTLRNYMLVVKNNGLLNLIKDYKLL